MTFRRTIDVNYYYKRNVYNINNVIYGAYIMNIEIIHRSEYLQRTE